MTPTPAELDREIALQENAGRLIESVMGIRTTGRQVTLIREGLATLAAARSGLDVERDGERWRAAEAEGHIVDFTKNGYGLMHPPSCRPNLIGCDFNSYLALALDHSQDMPPGRYSMSWDGYNRPEYVALQPSTEGSER